MGFADSFCNSQNSFLPPPIPPPRAKKNLKSAANLVEDVPVKAQEENLIDEPLIQLESLDEISLFDPLKGTNIKDSDVFSFLAPKAVTDAKVAELKNTIQNLASSSVIPQQSSYYQSSAFYPPKLAQPGLMLPRYPMPLSQSPILNNPAMPTATFSNGIPPLETSKPPIPPKETKPALPPKTRPSSSRFFVPTSEISEDDKELLSDYGLSNSPIFQGTFNESSKPAENTDWLVDSPGNTLDPFCSGTVSNKVSPRASKKETKVQSTWQKFT